MDKRTELYERYRNLAHKQVERFHPFLAETGIEFEDLHMEVECQLLETIDKLLPRLDDFSDAAQILVYLKRAVSGKISDFIKDNLRQGLTFEIGNNKYFKICNGEFKIRTIEDLLDTLFILDRGLIKSLDQNIPIEDGIATLHDSIEDESIESAESQLIAKEKEEAMRAAVCSVSDRTVSIKKLDRHILALLRRGESQTLGTIATKFNVSIQTVVNHTKKLLKKIKVEYERLEKIKNNLTPEIIEPNTLEDLTDVYLRLTIEDDRGVVHDIKNYRVAEIEGLRVFRIQIPESFYDARGGW